MRNEYDYLFKVVIVGDMNTGKTSVLRRYVDDTFAESMLTTIGVDFKIKTLELENRGIARSVKLQIWDTAGQERFNTLAKSYAHGAHCIILVFSYDDVDSLEHVDKWHDDMYSMLYSTHPDPYFLLLGNKCDLAQKAVSAARLKEFMDAHPDFVQIDTSAKTGENVREAFEVLARECMARFNETYKHDALQQNKDTFRLTEFPEPGGEEQTAKKCC